LISFEAHYTKLENENDYADSTIKNSGTILIQYTWPVHPDVVSNKPGKCPKCGMGLSLSKREQMKA